MRKLEREVCIEDYISRIPGLFAYVGTEGDDAGVLHHSYDSIDGCYGHVPANVTIPNDASLFYYRVMEYDSSLQYDEVDVVPDVIGLDGALYIKKEEYIDEGPVYSYYEKYELVNGSTPLTYSTLMYLYRKYNNSDDVPLAFVSFVENAIGFVHVTRPTEIADAREYDLVPDSFYLSQVYKMYTEYDELSRVCKDGCDGLNKSSMDVCCACDRYKRMGGDVFKQYLQNMIALAKSQADALYDNSLQTAPYVPSMNINATIHASIEDLGYGSCYVNELVLGNPVYDGELVTYNDRTYVCCLTGYVAERYMSVQDGYGDWLRDNYEYVKVKDKYYQYTTSHTYELYTAGVPEHFSDSTSGYMNPDTMTLEFDKAHFVLLTDYVTHEDNVNEYNPSQTEIDGFYCDGNTNGSSYLFGDLNNADLQCVWGYGEFGVGGNPEITIAQKSEAVEMTSEPATLQDVTGDMVVYPEYVVWNNGGVDKYYCKKRIVLQSGSTVNVDDYSISGNSDSKLKSLRRFVGYLNEGGFVEFPENGEDWLYYYKIGYVSNISLECDSVGNILRSVDTAPVFNIQDKYFYAHGDVITNITRDEVNRTVTITYVLGAHLTAELASQNIDNDGNIIYTYSNFHYDQDSLDGVIYTETYGYDTDSDLADINLLADDTAFTDYVTLDSYQSFMVDNPQCYYKKFAFKTAANTTTSIVSIMGSDMSYSYQVSGFETIVPNSLDMLNAPVFKKDEFVGVSYEPDVNGDVRIDRGNAASRERHLKLGDVMTVDAMENYSNGGFFNIRNDG